jgi:predicted nucleic-acid-binding protein
VRGLDTNLLVRYVTDDDPAQAALVQALFRDMEAVGERLHVSCIVLCELCWTLRGYDCSREDISAVLTRILATCLFDGITHGANTREVGPIRIAGYKSKGQMNKRIEVELGMFTP